MVYKGGGGGKGRRQATLKAAATHRAGKGDRGKRIIRLTGRAGTMQHNLNRRSFGQTAGSAARAKLQSRADLMNPRYKRLIAAQPF